VRRNGGVEGAAGVGFGGLTGEGLANLLRRIDALCRWTDCEAFVAYAAERSGRWR